MKLLIFILLISLFLIGCEKQIGGETDEHGCLGAAGYTFNETVGACIREWELDEEQRKAAKFIIMVQSAMFNTIVKVDTLECEGCFIVHLQRGNGDEVIPITLENWKITHKDNKTLEEAFQIADQ